MSKQFKTALRLMFVLFVLLPVVSFAQDIAQGKPAFASSTESGYPASNAFDNNDFGNSRWSSDFSDPQWIYVDLQQEYELTAVNLLWEAAYGRDYRIQVSDDAQNWTTIYTKSWGNGGTDNITLSGTGRYVRLYGTARGTEWGYSLFSFRVYGNPLAEYSLTASSTSGGSIDPEGVTTVLSGSDQAFTITPDAGYDVVSLLVDGQATTISSPYTFTNITDNHTIAAQFGGVPTANDDSYTTDEDVALSVTAPGVIENDSDIEQGAMTVSLVSNVSIGTLTLNADGSFNYVPEANYSGVVTFGYQLVDADGFSSIAIATIVVNAVNDAPVAQNDVYTVNENGSLTVGAPGLLLNDSDLDGDQLTASLLNAGTGSIQVSIDGSFVYTPVANFAGSDVFTYEVSDGILTTTATVTMAINAVVPTIITQPASQEVIAGEIATFSVAASGSNLSYQWWKNDLIITGAHSASYTTPVNQIINNGDFYIVAVSNSAGRVPSTMATLSVVEQPVPPTIITQPVNVTQKEGKVARFVVEATGTGALGYQWMRGTEAISGATSAEYITDILTLVDNGAQFSVVVSNSLGFATSDVVTLTVVATLPENKKIAINGTLFDDTGAPLGTGTPVVVDVIISLMDAKVGGTALYTESFLLANDEAITVENGYFTVRLGEGNTAEDLEQVVTGNNRLWVEMIVDDGTPDVLSPRSPLTASAYTLGNGSNENPETGVIRAEGNPNENSVNAEVGTYYVNTLDLSTWLKIATSWIIVE
ncbi:MAG: tandem-95 repeat protein [Fibrobacterales bacterium]